MKDRIEIKMLEGQVKRIDERLNSGDISYITKSVLSEKKANLMWRIASIKKGGSNDKSKDNKNS